MPTAKMKSTIIVPTDGNAPDLVYQEGLTYEVSDEFAATYATRLDIEAPPEKPAKATKG